MKRKITNFSCWLCAAVAGAVVFFWSDPEPAAGSREAPAIGDVYDADEFPEPAAESSRAAASAELGEYRQILCLLPRIFFAPGDDAAGLPLPNSGNGMVKNLAEMAKTYRDTAVLQNTFALLKLGAAANAGGGDLSKNINTITQLYRQAGGTEKPVSPDSALTDRGDTAKTLGEMMKRYRRAAETGNPDAAGF